MAEREKSSIRVLIVEDDADLRHLFSTQLTLAGYGVEAVDDGLAALRRIDEHPPDLLVLDLGLPSFPGDSIANELAASAHTRSVPVVVVTGQLTVPPPANAACVLWKPVTLRNLITAIERCLEDALPTATQSRQAAR